ncbi:MAG: pitrilysin family protein [Candidatus Neomarinimicrobiota bacterium]|jgi:zinc protease|nr:pitrilysin family protein [Candidatus Neomarinimicrobiota bacterium]MDD3966774.1 pitrilysin family protein [Candidatus Neomarinimicrobiota bacterium]MDX9779812.1 pitrilysin family protein [bacterium]
MKTIRLFAILSAFFLLLGCGSDLAINYEKYKLENGLDVILHVDKSDPITAVAIQYHVGSNREQPGKTGFAHLFEHMLFQESENVPQDAFFSMIQDAGGTLNGGTWTDGTVYYEVVPKNALEMVLWMESDRMGYLINTVTPSAFTNQQNVVVNEKRQRVDNNPYGHRDYVIGKALYPEDHPYNWQVIGEAEDVMNATIEDVKAFYDAYYGPNNATLVVAGDIDIKTLKPLIEKYFGEIRPHGDPEKLVAEAAVLKETKKLFHEDNFARAAQLTLVWPTVEEYHDDAYALGYLSHMLSVGKKAPLYKVLVRDKNLTSSVSAYNYAKELAGEFYIRITANTGQNLNDVENAIMEAFVLFEKEGVSDRDIERVKARLETSFYSGMSSVLDKSFNLAMYNTFTGDPGFVVKDLEKLQSVSKEDVMRVYEKYIKGKHYVAASFVPKGETDKIVAASLRAQVVEEDIQDAGRVEQAEQEDEPIQKTPSAFDRSVQPKKGPMPEVPLPGIWNAELKNGMKIYGIRHNELPLVNYEIILRGGRMLDSFEKPGVANLITDLMMEGTKHKTPEELEEAIDLLGASYRMYTGQESIVLAVSCLARNFEKSLTLAEEILLEPRWDEEQFTLAKTRTINAIKRAKADASTVASQTFSKLLYGNEHILSIPSSGTEASVEAIGIDDLKAFYEANFSPSVASFEIVGAVKPARVKRALSSLERNWEAKEVNIPVYPLKPAPERSEVYFVDMPGAKQSQLMVGYPALDRNHPDFYPATVMNYKLGGAFSGRINLVLREEKGYTYGARSGFSGTKTPGPFYVSTSVGSATTLESLEIIRDLMKEYREGVSEEDLTFTKNAILKSNARKFETLSDLMSVLWMVDYYGKDADYIRQEETITREMTLEGHKELAQRYLCPEKMYYLVVGDAETQLEQLEKLGFGKPVLLEL